LTIDRSFIEPNYASGFITVVNPGSNLAAFLFDKRARLASQLPSEFRLQSLWHLIELACFDSKRITQNAMAKAVWVNG
jgi:hypothetical protein